MYVFWAFFAKNEGKLRFFEAKNTCFWADFDVLKLIKVSEIA
jgi:hypothetical protein